MPRTIRTGWCDAPDLAPVNWLCDAMLGRLARLLRAAGEDVAMVDPGADDRAVVARGRREGRRLLTRDRRLAETGGADALWIAAQAPMEQAEALARLAPVDWRGRRFTRCTVDNALLRDATPAEIAGLPGAASTGAGPFRACPACGRLYWPGSHVRQLAERLDRLADVAASAFGTAQT